jgi:hypothetical protein
MDIRRAVNEFVSKGRELLDLLQSSEGKTLPSTELVLLKVQLHLLQSEAAKLEVQSRDPSKRA